jgi:hypothetical protein
MPAAYGVPTVSPDNEEVAIFNAGTGALTETAADACTLPTVVVAVTTTVPACIGAVSRPLFEIEPPLVDQTTAVFEVFVTVAANCSWAPAASWADAGLSVTEIWRRPLDFTFICSHWWPDPRGMSITVSVLRYRCAAEKTVTNKQKTTAKQKRTTRIGVRASAKVMGDIISLE